MRIEVYTALVGPLAPRTLPSPLPGADRYLCLTDREDLTLGPEWETRMIFGWPPNWKAPTDYRALARYVKLHPDICCSKADVSIWMDGSFTFLQPPDALVDRARICGTDLVAFAHPDRDRILEEAAVLIRYRLADAARVQEQLAHYAADGFDTPDNPMTRLTTTGLLVRRHTPAMLAFHQLWYTQIRQFTVRDQLSVDYCAWKLGLQIGYLDGHYRANPYVQYHRNRRIQKP